MSLPSYSVRFDTFALKESTKIFFGGELCRSLVGSHLCRHDQAWCHIFREDRQNKSPKRLL